MKFKTLYHSILSIALISSSIGFAADKGGTNPFVSEAQPSSTQDKAKKFTQGLDDQAWSKAKEEGDDQNRAHYNVATLVGISCGAAHHAMNYLGIPKRITEPACSLTAPIVAGLIAHCYFGTTATYTLGTAATSLIACRGSIDLGNTGIATTKKVKTTVLRLKNLPKSSDEDTEEEEGETEPKTTVLVKKKEKK